MKTVVKRKAITNCHKGHPLEGDNLIIESYGNKTCRRCRACKNERARRYERLNRDRAIERNKTFRAKNPDRIVKYDHKSTIKKYGLTVEQYNNLLNSQNGGCAICGKTNPSNINLAVDHCHTTGKIRGLLCQKCNQALGLFHDNVDNMEKAISYLKDNK